MPTTASDAPTVELLDASGSGRAVVLGGGLRQRGSGLAAGDERDDRARGGGEGRFALRGVERRDPTRRAGADVDEAAAGPQPLGDGVHGRCDGGRCFGDGTRNRCILGVDQRDELLGLAALVARSRVAPRLRDQRIFDHRASLRLLSSGGQYQL